MKQPLSDHDFSSDEAEENYFVSLSDLMTGVLFIFVILTTALALHYHLKAEQLPLPDPPPVTPPTPTNNPPKPDSPPKPEEPLDPLAKLLREREQMRKAELEGLVRRLRESKLKLIVELDDTNGILRLPGKLLFEPAEAKMRIDAEAALSLLASEMISVVRKGCGDSVLKWEAIYIEGHTDDKPISKEFASNWELSTARAISTFKALMKHQPSLGEFRNHQGKPVMGISGYGEQRPVAGNDTEDGRQKNRRIDIRFMMAYPSKTEIEEMEREFKERGKPAKSSM